MKTPVHPLKKWTETMVRTTVCVQMLTSPSWAVFACWSAVLAGLVFLYAGLDNRPKTCYN